MAADNAVDNIRRTFSDLHIVGSHEELPAIVFLQPDLLQQTLQTTRHREVAGTESLDLHLDTTCTLVALLLVRKATHPMLAAAVPHHTFAKATGAAYCTDHTGTHHQDWRSVVRQHQMTFHVESMALTLDAHLDPAPETKALAFRGAFVPKDLGRKEQALTVAGMGPRQVDFQASMNGASEIFPIVFAKLLRKMELHTLVHVSLSANCFVGFHTKTEPSLEPENSARLLLAATKVLLAEERRDNPCETGEHTVRKLLASADMAAMMNKEDTPFLAEDKVAAVLAEATALVGTPEAASFLLVRDVSPEHHEQDMDKKDRHEELVVAAAQAREGPRSFPSLRTS